MMQALILFSFPPLYLSLSLDIPMDLPKTTKRLLLNDNKITSIPAFGLFNRLPNLLTVDLSRNKISNIEEGAFEGANSIIEM
jgi:Leucine-rich repeat (LRR) protein